MRDTSNIFVAGGVSIDLVVHLDELPPPRPQTIFGARFTETLGSTGAGKAINLSRLGFDVALHATIGDDAQGQRAREILAGQGVDFFYDIDPAGTQRHVNLMGPGGQRISIYLRDGSFEPDIAMGPIDKAIARADLVALNIRNYCRYLIPGIKASNKPIWVDIHDYDGHAEYHRDFIEAADYLFASSQALADYRSFMREMNDLGKALVVCTHGAGGATALSAAGQWIDAPIAEGYRPVDSNGAGDAFFSGFIYGHSRGDSVERCMQLATLCAGLCVASPELYAAHLDPELLEAEHRSHYSQPPDV